MKKEDQIIEMLETITQKLDGHSNQLQRHEDMLKEHGEILVALRSGQEHLKAELDGFKVSTAKDFGIIKDEQSNTNAKLDVLQHDTWENKVDIQRMKKTIGLA